MSARVYQQVTNTILEALNRGVVPWRKPWRTTATLPRNAISNKAYRGVNVWLLALAPYLDPRWLTFKQAQERGGHVRKGERSTMVVFWKQWDVPENEEAEKPSRQVPILRTYNVFNAEQCEGLELPELEEIPTRPEHERIQAAEALVRSMPNPPSIAEGGREAWYRPSTDHIQIPPLSAFDSPDAYYVTLLHEIGHSTGHESRLARPGVMERAHFGSGEYSREELVAELTSAYCCGLLGLNPSILDSSASYIGSWLKVLKEDRKATVIAAAQAQRAAEHIQGR